jgi:hypothetical protein
MKKAILVLAGALMMMAPVAASAARGVVVVRGGYFGGGPYWGPYWGSYWGPGYVGPYYAYPNSGEVKLDTKVKDAEVFINGAFAGTTHDNKTMRLRPGNYDIQIREAGRMQFAQQVYVIAGKTVHLHPEL